ncbi:MAG: transcription antitermination factor NusB [Saprospiraceae bacterium]|nr:transcription antitermination factor NusB [Saprospiraceae bacterium]
MLSRRNVRIKAMQQLYSLSQDRELSFSEAMTAFRKSIQDAFLLYMLNLHSLVKVCSFASEDANHRSKKHIRSEEDKVFTDKLYTNPKIQSLATNKPFQDALKKEGFDKAIDDDLFRKIYKEFAKEASYVQYISNTETTDEDTVEVLLELYRACRRNELFNEIMDDLFASWADDKSLVIGSVKKTIKALPVEGKFFTEFLPDEETVEEVGTTLLQRIHDEGKELDQLIEPLLENWDSERVAIIDMILIKMGVVEMKYLKTIPTKVTIDEYVELSKMYSTDKSKEFVNGVLDKLLKVLQDQGMIVKEGRGLLES